MDEDPTPIAGGTDEGEPRLSGAPHEPVVLDDRPIEGQAPSTPDAGWWSDVDRRHRAIVIGALSAGVIVLAVGIGIGIAVVGSSLSAGGSDATPTVTVGSIPTSTPAEESTIPMPAETTGTASTPASATVGLPGRAPYVAYRKDGAVWVATESGGEAKRVFAAAQGPFALSPDGRTLAAVDAAAAALALIDVETGRTAIVGTAIAVDRPAWSPDSAFVVYTAQQPTAHETEVWRVARDGSGRSKVGLGFGARVSSDGRIVAVSSMRTAKGTPAEVFEGATSRLIGKDISANAVAPLPGAIVVADAGGLIVQGAARQPSIEIMGRDGTGMRELVKRTAAGQGVFFGDLWASPDGSWVAYTETGDDGYSRLFAIRPSGGGPVSLSVRRDDYIVGWSADGSEVLFVEGNALQGEATRLMAVHPDGTGRRTVVDGAGL